MDGGGKDKYEEVQLMRHVAQEKLKWRNRIYVADSNVVETRL